MKNIHSEGMKIRERGKPQLGIRASKLELNCQIEFKIFIMMTIPNVRYCGFAFYEYHFVQMPMQVDMQDYGKVFSMATQNWEKRWFHV